MANIIQFPGLQKPVKTSLFIKQDHAFHKAFKCQHKKMLLCFEDKKVYCQDCGQIIDPFFALYQFAEDERTFVFHCAEENAALEELKKIQSEWKLTTREKRRVSEARKIARLEAIERYKDAAKIQDRKKF